MNLQIFESHTQKRITVKDPFKRRYLQDIEMEILCILSFGKNHKDMNKSRLRMYRHTIVSLAIFSAATVNNWIFDQYFNVLTLEVLK